MLPCWQICLDSLVDPSVYLYMWLCLKLILVSFQLTDDSNMSKLICVVFPWTHSISVSLCTPEFVQNCILPKSHFTYRGNYVLCTPSDRCLFKANILSFVCCITMLFCFTLIYFPSKTTNCLHRIYLVPLKFLCVLPHMICVVLYWYSQNYVLVFIFVSILITSYGLSLFPAPHNLTPNFTCFGPSFEMQVYVARIFYCRLFVPLCQELGILKLLLCWHHVMAVKLLFFVVTIIYMHVIQDVCHAWNYFTICT
jgi:hypothetical protein